jgi:uncharacterized protein (DUF362 family)
MELSIYIRTGPRMEKKISNVIIGKNSDETMANAFKSLPYVENYVIKVNLCTIATCPVTTGIESVNKVIKYILEINPDAKIKVVESDATALNVENAFKRLGYNELRNAKIVDLSNDDAIKVDVNGRIIGTLTVPLTLYECDCLINMARLKTHVFTKVSLGSKNLFGLVTKKDKESLHPYLDNVLVDLMGFYRPSLTIIEGNLGMEGRGPVDGSVRLDDVLIAGDDVLAADLVASSYMGIKNVPHLELAEKVLGKRKINLIREAGLKNPAPYKTVSFLPYNVMRLGFLASSLGKRFEMFGNSISFVGDVLSSVERDVIEQKISYRDAFQVLIQKSTKINI